MNTANACAAAETASSLPFEQWLLDKTRGLAPLKVAVAHPVDPEDKMPDDTHERGNREHHRHL